MIWVKCNLKLVGIEEYNKFDEDEVRIAKLKLD